MHTVHGSDGSGDVRLWSSLPSRLPLLKSHTRGDTEDNHKAALDGDVPSSAWCALLSACALLLSLFRVARSTLCQRGNSDSSVSHVCRQRQGSCRPLRRCALLLLLCAALSVLPRAHATLIASSRISYCTNSGTDAIKCTRKMVVTLTVEAGQQAGEESLVFVNSAVDDTVSAGDAADAATVHFAPISITTSRSAVRYRYPIFYVQNYNAEPYEATVKGRLLNQCNADFNPDTATCGLAYDATGKAIPFSQGFCCDCSMCQTLGFCRPGARANKACNVFDEYTTASCLRFGQRWYSGYSIGTYLTWFTLNITVARNVSASGDAGTGVASAVQQQSVVLQLSPTVLGDTAGEGWGASARLVGSFAPADQPLDLTSRLLFAPALPATDERVGAGAAEWMLLSNTLVTLDGRECNKVGVSYEAFASQGNRCNLNPGSCLGSQLEDYRTADLARVAAGKKAQYMATGYGNFDLERVVNEADGGKTSPYISYVAASPAATMVVLTVAADDLEYIVGVANGKIVSAVLNKATLETSAKDGLMTVVVKNLAAATGRLVVSVQNCTEGVFPIAAQTLSLTPQQQSSLQFNVYMQSNPASGRASCTVVVRNAEEVVTDSRVVSWAVTETGFNNGTQGGTAGGGGGGSTTEESSAATCGGCATLNIVCAVQRTCWSLILLDLAVYLVIAAVVFCIIWFRRVVCCCFFRKRHRRRSGSRSRSSSRQRHRRHHRRRGSSDGSCHSPTRGEEGGRGSSSGHHHTSHRRSRSRASNTKSRRRSTSPQRRHTSRESSCGGEARYDTAVLPYPPPMTYAAAPPYLPPATYLSGGAYGAATPFSSSPFASPLRVQPPPPQLLPQAMPPAGYVPSLHSSCGYDTPSGYLSPRAFCPASSGSFAVYSPSPSPPPPPPTPPASGMAYGIGNRSPASQSPYTPALSACGADYATGEDNVFSHARASARPRQHRRQRRRRSGSLHRHASHSRSPSPSQFSVRRERDPYA